MSASDDGIFVLGNFKLIEVLGIGAMGYVYRARQLNLDRDVAVKILSPKLAQEPGYLDLFFREAHTAAALEHPHIVPIFDYGVQQNVSYVAMRLLLGGSLGEKLQYRLDRGLALPSIPEVTALLLQAASALDYAHARGVIHRDIKPTNLMFDQHGAVYIVDFGIAKLIGTTSSIKGGTFLGTPSFMAPEQWEGLSPTPAVDQYALGAVIYMMITGHPPFESDTALALMSKHLKETPKDIREYRPNLPDMVNTLLRKSMAKQPEDRFPDAMTFAQEFTDAVREFAGEKSTGFLTYTLPQPSFSLPFPTPTGLVATSSLQDAKVIAEPPSTLRLSPRGRNIMLWVETVLLVVSVVLIVILLVQRSASDPPPAAAMIATRSSTATPLDDPPSPTDSDGNIGLVQFQSTDTPTTSDPPLPTATATATFTFTPSPTSTDTATMTFTPSDTATPTATDTATDTATFTQTFTATPSPTSTETAVLTSTPSNTPTFTSTYTRTFTPTFTLTPSPAATETQAVTAAVTAAATDTPAATETAEVTAAATATVTPTVIYVPRPNVPWHNGSHLRINNTAGAWLRSHPSTRAAQIATLAYNNLVTATGNYFYDGRQFWWEVRAAWGAVGWVEQYSLIEQ